MARLFANPFYTALDSNGDPISGAKLEFFLTLTSTPHDTYTDNALAVAHANPVIADSSGRFAPIYLQDADYKVVLKDAADVVVKTIDPVHGGGDPSTGTLPKSANYTVVAADKGKIILVDASGGALTITLLPAVAGFVVGVKKIDSSANKVTIDGDGAETIDGSLTLDLEGASAPNPRVCLTDAAHDQYSDRLLRRFEPDLILAAFFCWDLSAGGPAPLVSWAALWQRHRAATSWAGAATPPAEPVENK